MIFEKRGRWCYRDDNGILHKFATEEAAKLAAGWVPPVEELLSSSKEETGTDEQAPVHISKKSSKKKI